MSQTQPATNKGKKKAQATKGPGPGVQSQINPAPQEAQSGKPATVRPGAWGQSRPQPAGQSSKPAQATEAPGTRGLTGQTQQAGQPGKQTQTTGGLGSGGQSQTKPAPQAGQSGKQTQATGGPGPEGQSQAQKGGQSGAMVNSLFPSKPARQPNTKPPGNRVILLTNLFKISIKQEKPIYRYTIEIDAVEKQDDGDTPTKKGPPRKIMKETRVAAVNKAINDWISNNDKNRSICSLTFSYVLDTNASTMFALFDMKLQESSGKRRTEVDVCIQVPFIDKVKGLVMENKSYIVKIHDGTTLDVRGLIDYCSGKGTRDYDKYRDHLRALNVIFLGQITTVPHYLVIENSKTNLGSVFPYNTQNQFKISEGIFCNRGFNTSVRSTENGLVLNVANTVVPFHDPMKLTDLLARRFRVNDFSKKLEKKIVEALTKEIATKQVEATHINYGTQQKPHYRKYRVKEIGSKSTNEEKFEFNGKSITVAEYFVQEYKITLKHPSLPCVIDNGRKIPLELCRLVDRQKVNRKLTPIETSNVIKEAALRPERHFDAVKNNVKQVCQHSQSVKDFGLEINPVPIEVTGRELPSIKLLGGNKMGAAASQGQYMLPRSGFVRAASVGKWAIVVLLDSEVKRSYKSSEELQQDAARFSSMYAQAGIQKGVRIQPTKEIRQVEIVFDHLQLKKSLRVLFEELNSNQFDLALFLLPSGCPDWTYSYIQYLEGSTKGTRKTDRKCTRVACIKFYNFFNKILRDPRGSQMFLSNLWLKHNTKLGGINIVLDSTQNFGIDDPKQHTQFLSQGYLFVSIDVCHPAPGDRLKQSVAAAVGMWNLCSPGMSYCTRLRVQRKEKSDQDKSTVEEVGEIGVMFQEILESYRAQMDKKLPTHVVILRDGVSEGQFKMVLQKELVQVKQVLVNFYNKEKVKAPLLTCLTVQKRHKVRFMRKEAVQGRKGPDFNIQPGTVVDSNITPANAHSFYLAPHKAIQGTARAPYIYMIYDEIKFSQDSAQAMIHALSYLSPRCTKGTSIPTPVNMADLAAERGKNVVVSWNEDNTARMTDGERMARLNAFLSTMGDEQYKNALFYI